jgi:hypothetical protein
LEGSKVKVKKEKMDEGGIDWYKMKVLSRRNIGPTILAGVNVLHVNTHPDWRGCDATSPGS